MIEPRPIRSACLPSDRNSTRARQPAHAQPIPHYVFSITSSAANEPKEIGPITVALDGARSS